MKGVPVFFALILAVTVASAPTVSFAKPAKTKRPKAAAAAAAAPTTTKLQRFHDRLKRCQRSLEDSKLETRVKSTDANACVIDKEFRRQPVIVKVRKGKSVTPGYDVVVTSKYKGVGTDYEVRAPQGLVVISIKIPIGCRGTNNKLKLGKKRLKQKELERLRKTPETVCQEIYVQATRDYRWPELIKSGRWYLESVFTRANAWIAKRNVRSRVFKDKLASEVISRRIAISQFVVEHIDASLVARALENRTMTVAQYVKDDVPAVLASIGANRERSYDYSISYANAGFFAQFTRPAYTTIRKFYPAAKLPASYVDCMQDHVCAAVANFLHNDFYLAHLRDRAPHLTHRLRSRGDRVIGQYLCASYNAGGGRVAPIIARNPNCWTCAGSGLADQPRLYVKIFDAVYPELYPEPKKAVPLRVASAKTAKRKRGR